MEEASPCQSGLARVTFQESASDDMMRPSDQPVHPCETLCAKAAYRSCEHTDD